MFDDLSFDECSPGVENYGRYPFVMCLLPCAYILEETHVKKILSILLLGVAIFTFAFNRPALAAGDAAGAKIFSANCAACHAGGKNAVQPNKTLFKDALEKYGMNSAEAIITQVTKGKNAMPAFKGRLNDQQIENVAAYVLSQSDKGWK